MPVITASYEQDQLLVSTIASLQPPESAVAEVSCLSDYDDQQGYDSFQTNSPQAIDSRQTGYANIARLTPPDVPFLTPDYRTGEPHSPLRMKDSRLLPSHEERVNAYNNAYYHCIAAKTDLIPWLKKQYSKGPPDTMFEYVPPPKRSSKGLFSLFKKKKYGENPIGQTNEYLKSMISLSQHVSASQSPPLERKLRRPKSMPGPSLSPSERLTPSPVVEEPVSILKKKKDAVDERLYYSDSEQHWDLDSDKEDELISPSYSDIMVKDRPRKKNKSVRRKHKAHAFLVPPVSIKPCRRFSMSSNASINSGYYPPPMAPIYPYDAMLPRRASWALDAWERSLDDLCEYFRHIDRDILEQYLESACGDFETAKQMCIEDIMAT
ncbi:hypothetical protein EC973_007943 [Apophysomyces ossiformis]|uniref:Uncharacterized protein n=1 Tax=Apophysomyces ossiformis TaxID=679940 RepID=A0A8H7BP76_9FUNG|nr:hypothetical protein EC973_007943 [Apophysomyces ossiformis]